MYYNQEQLQTTEENHPPEVAHIQNLYDPAGKLSFVLTPKLSIIVTLQE